MKLKLPIFFYAFFNKLEINFNNSATIKNRRKPFKTTPLNKKETGYLKKIVDFGQ